MRPVRIIYSIDMTTDYQIRVTPQVAASEQSILHFLADEKGVDVTKVTTTRIVKRSIDARQRNIHQPHGQSLHQ